MSYMTFAVESSAVESMGYDTEKEELTIVYTGGGEYRYLDVPFNVATAAADAESVGRYVNENIKGVYESYDPSKWMNGNELEELMREADKLNEKVSEATADMVASDPIAPFVNNLLDSLEAFSSEVESRLPF